MYFVCAMRTETMQRCFAVLLDWADEFDLSEKLLMQLKTASTFPTKVLFDLICFIQSTVQVEEAIPAIE